VWPVPRLTLFPVDGPTARRIQAGSPAADDSWAPDYPFEGDVTAITAFLRADEQAGEQRPFGYYQIIRAADSVVVGGIGFHGPPVGGTAEIGYGLAPSARGQGYAAEALAALMKIAAANGVHRLLADTTPDNVASQRTLVRAGFVRLDAEAEANQTETNQAEANETNETDEALWYYAADLSTGRRAVAGETTETI
jgi:RimJ/RimL family protein N-acetyltransferase